ncbi:hypothetical protein WV31_00175 [Magnetospirillum sp. ME-1]|nr:hypothetical protein WV31_00175 [Magnetospirillum sp. ME-1]
MACLAGCITGLEISPRQSVEDIEEATHPGLAMRTMVLAMPMFYVVSMLTVMVSVSLRPPPLIRRRTRGRMAPGR